MDRLIAILIAFLAVAPCSAAVITVDASGSADYQSIQEAVNNAQDGDTIVVRPGTYTEEVGFNGRRVTLRSQDPNEPTVVAATIITSDSGHSVYFDFGEGSASVLEGFTITGHGVFCAGTGPTISKNVIHDCTGAGIGGERDAAPIIVGNTITACTQEGIYGCGGRIEDNTISRNYAGIAYSSGPIRNNTITDNDLEGIYACENTIEGNVISGNSAGLGYCDGLVLNNRIIANGSAGGLYYCDGDVVGNVIVGNVASSDGGGLFGCYGTIRNNVIAGNRSEGDGGGLADCSQSVCNNTVVGNRAAGVGGGLSRCGGTVCNNIIAYNEASQAGGIYGASSQTYNAFWTNTGGNFGGNAVAGTGDAVVNPQFAAAGAWDGDLWTDGDYHLKSQVGRWNPESRQWVVDEVASPCIDAGDPGSDVAAELWPHGGRINVGAFGGTSQASWSSSGVGLLADLTADGKVGPDDFASLAAQWLVREDLLAADLDRNGYVDFLDFVLMAAQWRAEPAEATAPDPNPMTWAIEPYGTGPDSIAMVATTAVSSDASGVAYYFENRFDFEMNSGWLTFAAGQEPAWEVSGLEANTSYAFRVKARNQGNLLETDWSETVRGTTERQDSTAPTPDPMTWETEPYGSAPDTITMVATAAVDPSGVEYRFECTSDAEYSSDWQDSRVYEVTSVPQGHYTFRVQARDKSALHNATTASASATADLQPPTPDPMEWEVEPYEANIGGGSFDYYAVMTATEATDEMADVEYFFQCTTESAFSSGWQTSPEYSVKVGRAGQRHRFRVKARDTSVSHNETDWSSVETAQ